MGVPGARAPAAGHRRRHVLARSGASTSLREHLHLRAGHAAAGVCGPLHGRKKLPVLIDAVRRLGRPYHLLLIGGGDQAAAATTAGDLHAVQAQPARPGAPAGQLRRAGPPGRPRNLRPDRARSDGLRPAGGGHDRRRRGRTGRPGHRHAGRAEQRRAACARASTPSTRRDLARNGQERAAQGARAVRLEPHPAATAAALRRAAGDARAGRTGSGADSCVTD